jgi:hypothetical protein
VEIYRRTIVVSPKKEAKGPHMRIVKVAISKVVFLLHKPQDSRNRLRLIVYNPDTTYSQVENEFEMCSSESMTFYFEVLTQCCPGIYVCFYIPSREATHFDTRPSYRDGLYAMKPPLYPINAGAARRFPHTSCREKRHILIRDRRTATVYMR